MLSEYPQLFMDTTDASQVIVTDGTLQLNQSLRVAGYLTGSQIVAGAGYELVVDYSYNGGAGVEITAIPEPATVVLLGLGGLALIRRKR